MVLVARIRSRAALRLRAFSFARRLIASSEPMIVPSAPAPSSERSSGITPPSAGAAAGGPGTGRIRPASRQASFRKATAQPAPSTTQNTALAMAVATMNIRTSSAGARLW